MKNPINQSDVSRRQFLKRSSLAVAGASVAPYILNAAEEAAGPVIKVGLIGCGGRGSGAIRDAMKASRRVLPVALADIFPDKVNACREALVKEGRLIGPEMCFSGFDAYQKILAIKEINYVILATPPGFRPLHFAAAVEAGKNVFMEKPVATDAPGIRTVLKAADAAKQKGLAVVAGTQRRHDQSYIETIKRIQDGAIGDVISLCAYWNQGAIWNHPWKEGVSDMENQLRNWYHYVWLCGDHICEQHVHNLDVCNWIMKGHPVKAYGRGARQVLTGRGQIYDHFSVEYEYANGTRMFSQCRQIEGCANRVSEFVLASKGTSDPNHWTKTRDGQEWKAPGSINAYVVEHTDLIRSIRAGQPLNEGQQVAESTLTAIMGRESAYSGQEVKWDDILNSTKNIHPQTMAFSALPAPQVAVPGKYRFM